MFRWFIATLAATISMASANAAFVVNVIPATGPVTTNPSFTNWANNAAQALFQGTNQTTGATTPLSNGNFGGAPGVPTFYTPSPNGTQLGGGAINYLTGTGSGVSDMFYTQAGGSPTGINVGGAYSTQTGNVTYFGLAITSTAGTGTFTANDVNFTGSYAFPGVVTPVNLGSVLGFGSNYFLDQNGNPITSPSQAVSAMFYVGVGGGIFNTPGADFTSPGTLNDLVNNPLTPAGLMVGQYTVSGVTGGAAVDINGAPAPATLGLIGLGLAGLIRRARRKA
jgi:hypothetical protein